MPQSLALVSLVVGDYDEAVEFFVSKLGFTLIEAQLSRNKIKDGLWSRLQAASAVAYSSRKHLRRSRDRGLGRRRAAGCFCFSTQMTCNVTIGHTRRRALFSSVNRRRNRSAPWRCSETFTAIYGT